MTQTSSFGASRREGHDSSAFYERNLYSAFFREPAPAKDLFTESPNLDGWVDMVYQQSSAKMDNIPDNSIGLAFTSPPYNVGKDYDDDMGLNEYLQLICDVGMEVFRVLKPGGRYVVNIANLGRKPYIPLNSFFYRLHAEEIGFLPMGEIIWQKARGASGSCAWGSWRSAKAPRLRDLHEYLLVFAKQSYSRPDKGQSTINSDEFMAATLSIWEIPPESAKRVGHPAPFPLELAKRVIQLYSYADDVVLDPFLGSGTTCVAAKQLGRRYVGFDISEDYCNLANARLEATPLLTETQLELVNTNVNGHK
jgi:site-specific DNA-methyltransferase (adenine-specific)